MKAFLALTLSWVFLQPAHAEVRSLRPEQSLARPANTSYEYLVGVAIDGPHIIVLAIDEGSSSHTYSALLYRRDSRTGRWAYRRTLLTSVGAFARMDVRMKNGIAAINFGGQVTLFEYANGDYVPARTVAPIRHPGGVAISANRVLIGGDNCDYDAVVYQRGTDGNWAITGWLDDNAGECETDGREVELNYDYAIVRPRYGGPALAWRRNGTAMDWIPSGVLALPPDMATSDKPYTLQGATAVANNGLVYRRSGTSTWTPLGKATSVDADNSFGITFDAVYRDGVLVTTESAYTAFPRVYLEAAPGRFEHVASLFTSDNVSHYDISGRTVVALARDPQATYFNVEIFTLPVELRAPDPIVNDFEDGNTSGFRIESGQFALATRGTDNVLEQSATNGMAIAVLADSDWDVYQRVTADLTPSYTTADSWVGLVVRYIDQNNFYFAAIRSGGRYAVYSRVLGVNRLMREGTFYPPGPGPSPGRVTLAVSGTELTLTIGSQHIPVGSEISLPRGRAGLATWRASADFDDLHVAGTSQYVLFYREWGPFGSEYEVDLTTAGGNWQVPQDEDGYSQALVQSDASGSAVAFIGTPVRNQDILARMRVDSFGTSSQGAWFGLLARYVDARNHYYVTIRSSGVIQIRKQVNGIITVLASAPFTPVPGQYYEVQFRVIDDQLELLVDGVRLASAHDGAISSGQYGVATYRTAARWQSLSAQQP